jgi:hypothetical protein
MALELTTVTCALKVKRVNTASHDLVVPSDALIPTDLSFRVCKICDTLDYSKKSQ